MMLDNLGNLQRTHTCGALRKEHVGQTVTLMGWVARRRDFGVLTFVDLRDRDGITQVVFNADDAPEAHAKAKEVRGEYVIAVTGEVTLRDESQHNPKIATGEVEVHARELFILNDARTLPFQIDSQGSEGLASEDLRLKYRYLDLRRPQLQANLRLRHRVLREIRRYMDEQGFTEIETPILIKSTPEGARDYIVPARVQPGKFFALPQSPQLFKQLCMIAGMDKYFQIAHCFRDEDLRADRQPEFTQLDVEMSFANPEHIYTLIEGLFARVFKLIDVDLPLPFPRLTFAEVMRDYGSDKPDLRNKIVMQEVSEHFRGSGFKVFARMLEDPKNQVWAIPGTGGGSRAFCDRMNSWAQGEGQPGLGYIMWREGGEGAGPLANNIGAERTAAIRAQLGLKEGDAAFFVAGDPEKFWKFAGLARSRLGEELKLIDKDRFELAWIVDFPMYEWNEEEKKIDFSHNPFSMPNMEPDAFLALDPNDRETLLSLKAIQYDIVCNGVELSSGAIRNHRPDVMKKAFAIAGYPEEVLEAKFGGMLRALSLGAPPHGGIAPGIDRIVMLLCGEENLREVVLFPMNQRAEDLMMGAPSEVTPKQLRELHIRLNLPQN